jgi:GTP-binding protein
MLSTLLYADSFLGRSLVGKISQGTAKANQPIKAINLKGEKVDEGRLTKIFRYEGTKKVPIEVGEAGDIVVIAGLEKANVADTICDLEVNDPLPATPIDPPTMSITISVNSSPLAGTEGKKINKYSKSEIDWLLKHKIMLEFSFSQNAKRRRFCN